MEIKKCILCGKEFEPKAYNAQICYREHYVPCRICQKPVPLDKRINRARRLMYLEKGFAYCSKECANKGIGLDKQIKAEEQIDMNKLKYYIEETAISIEDIAKIFNVSRDFIKARCIANNFIRSKELNEQARIIKNKVISKILTDKYKDENVRKEMIQKQRKTYKERTGYESNFQNPESKERSKQTKLRKYGNPNFVNPEKISQSWNKKSNKDKASIKIKHEQTCLKRYGEKNPLSIKEIQEKAKETKLKKYGNPNFVNPEKISQSWNKKSLEEKKNIIEKQMNHKKEKYGNNNNYEKVKKTNLEKYGYDNPFKDPKIKEKIKKTNMKKYGTIHPVTLFSYLNGKTISKINRSINQELINAGCKTKLEKNINNKSYDIFIEPNIVLEINPTYTHNSTIGPYMFGKRVAPKDKNYHIEKTLNAEKNGFICLHLFDWEDKEKIINYLKPKQKIYARNCDIKEISKEECNEFLNKYHFQNTCNGQNIRLGLYYKDNLIEIMSFGKPRYNKNYEYELLRLCSHCDYYIIGGSEKLFKYFIKEYNPNSIISYCDRSKFKGDVYRRLQFTFLNLSRPRVHWYNIKTKRHITDNLLRQRGFSQLHGDNNYEIYKKGDDNKELMIENEYVQVYDCGQATFIWEKSL